MILDTHIFLWWLFDDAKLSVDIRELIQNQNNTIYISSASVWEITTKHRIGKLSYAENIAINVPYWINKAGFSSLPISPKHAQLAGSYKDRHRDPFDRMLFSQSIVENYPLLTDDKELIRMINNHNSVS